MNGLAELRIRSARQSAKAHSKQRSKTGLQKKVTILLQNRKIIEKAIDKWYNKVKRRKESANHEKNLHE
jgi:hypothetical protein|uniref:Uncharacterized protein n=1 Tax=Microviridae sp. cty645 TaxID=2823616 RepID=A0A8S5LB34_9VIRU|nr:MAG TPA: hypothetical protein [Microviridae sp. cty645]